VIQTCMVRLIRSSPRYASNANWPQLATALRPTYTAANEEAALLLVTGRETLKVITSLTTMCGSAAAPLGT
jgi:transposase-like protein